MATMSSYTKEQFYSSRLYKPIINCLKEKDRTTQELEEMTLIPHGSLAGRLARLRIAGIAFVVGYANRRDRHRIAIWGLVKREGRAARPAPETNSSVAGPVYHRGLHYPSKKRSGE